MQRAPVNRMETDHSERDCGKGLPGGRGRLRMTIEDSWKKRDAFLGFLERKCTHIQLQEPRTNL